MKRLGRELLGGASTNREWHKIEINERRWGKQTTWTSALMMKTCMPTYLPGIIIFRMTTASEIATIFLDGNTRRTLHRIVEKPYEGAPEGGPLFFFFSFPLEFVRYRSFTFVTPVATHKATRVVTRAEQRLWQATDFHSINDRSSSFPLVSVSCGIDRGRPAQRQDRQTSSAGAFAPIDAPTTCLINALIRAKRKMERWPYVCRAYAF